MKKYYKETKNENETLDFAKNIGKRLFRGSVIALEGDLGAGKTTFTKGIAKALNIKKVVNSPTFTIIKEYNGVLPLYHMDVYRLDNDLEDLGFDEYFYSNGVTVIEWAKKIKSQLPEELLTINITIKDDTSRYYEIIANGLEYEAICEVLKHEAIID